MVVNLAIQSAFVSAGQRCTCARRIIVKHGVNGDAFIQRFVEVAKNLVIGAWDAEPQPFMGGVISSHAADQMMAAQSKLIALGAKPLLAMTRPQADSSLLSAGILDVSEVILTFTVRLSLTARKSAVFASKVGPASKMST
jgi:succinylglutamic semialdehyde dehydrogenase